MGRSIKATQTDVLLFLIRMYPKKSHSTKINVSVDAILYDKRTYHSQMEELYQEIPHITAQPSRLIPERDKIIGGIQKNPHLLFEEQMVWVNPLKESKAYYEEYSRYYPLKRSFIFCH